jgi:hypothetical protein
MVEERAGMKISWVAKVVAPQGLRSTCPTPVPTFVQVGKRLSRIRFFYFRGVLADQIPLTPLQGILQIPQKHRKSWELLWKSRCIEGQYRHLLIKLSRARRASVRVSVARQPVVRVVMGWLELL